MDEKDFFDRLKGLLENIKKRYELDTIHDALIMWFGENFLTHDPTEIAERIINDKHAEGVDSVLTDQINYKLLFIQAKTVETFDNTKNNFSEIDVKSTLDGIRFLIKGDYKGKITPELENLVDEYHELDKTGNYKTEILFVTLKKKPIDDKFITSFNQEFREINVIFYDFDALFDFYVNKYLNIRASAPERISFEVLTNLLFKDTPNKSRVFTCKGKELAKIYNDYRERIFQQNVRYSLGVRSKSINRQILETAIDDETSTSFWYFNNGITIVCKKISETTSGKVINLDYAQIINGAQTTYALHEAYKNGQLKDNVEVLIKAIETDDRNFIESVTLYTNSQNAIRLRDLCSNDEIQLKIQKIIDSYQYFYERKRGEFDSLYPTLEAKRKLLGDNYKNKVISNESAAQSFLAMYLNKPAQAKSEKGRIFMKDGGFYDEIFNKKDDTLAEKILMSWKLLNYIEMEKNEYKKKYREAEAEVISVSERIEIYNYDFLLHSEYFILNIFRDFLQNKNFDDKKIDINGNKDDLLKIISKIDSKNEQIRNDYLTIKNEFAECINELKKQPGYYHNKFFKNEKSIGLIRTLFNKKFNFINIFE
ncbi:MAG: AIPR family protein [Candidatus Methanoperedens sp.]|nr:AIPR family protein [Candidatus Methanoperedens sp.]MCZ7395106.1 AIPR family protein [Candidatus Methanoperedens sp.]